MATDFKSADVHLISSSLAVPKVTEGNSVKPLRPVVTHYDRPVSMNGIPPSTLFNEGDEMPPISSKFDAKYRPAQSTTAIIPSNEDFLPTAIPPVTARDEVAGVVVREDQNTIVIECELPNDVVELSFPRSMIPEELQSYGTNLWFKIITKGIFKTPSFRVRHVERNPHFTYSSTIHEPIEV